MGLDHLFVVLIYQPFLNILVGLYWLLGLFSSAGSFVTAPPPADMGVAVILFTIVLRVIMLPLTIAGDRSENERRDLEHKVKDLEQKLASHPIELAREKKKLLHGNKRMLISALFELFIQIVIAFMLWRIFARGLTGEDLYLIYSWMPEVSQPFNLVFLGKIDLTHPDLTLNLIQTFLLFILETLNMVFSPFPTTRKDVVRMQLTLPLVSFAIFAFLPAGKKLFVITALSFAIVYRTVRLLRRWLLQMFAGEVVAEAGAMAKQLEQVLGDHRASDASQDVHENASSHNS